MKKLFRDTFLIFSLLIPLSSAQIYNEDYSKPQKRNLFKENKVWMIYGWTFPNENGLKVKKGKKVSFKRFDRNGNRTEEVNYDVKGNTIYSCKYFFDKNGNEIQRIGIADGEEIDEKWEYAALDEKVIENTPEYKNTIKQTSWNSDDKHQNETEGDYLNKKIKFSSCEMFNDKEKIQTDEYSVNEKNYGSLYSGRIIEKKPVYKNAKNGKSVYKMDRHGNKSEEIYYNDKEMLLYKLQFDYDNSQLLIEKKEYDSFGNISEKWLYQYDHKGNNVEINQYASNNQLLRKYKFLYDKKGNMTAKFTFDKDENELDLTVYLCEFYGGLHAPRTDRVKE